jgi:hypothetical protein
MQGMTKKKRPDSQPEPKKGERPPHKMVRVPLELYERLRRVARKQQRPVSWEIKIALESHAEKNGEPSPRKPPDTE